MQRCDKGKPRGAIEHVFAMQCVMRCLLILTDMVFLRESGLFLVVMPPVMLSLL